MCNKKPYQKILILVAGVTMNFLLALLLFFLQGMIWGSGEQLSYIGVVTPDSAIEKAGEILPQKLFITVNYEFTIEQTEFFENQIKYTVLNKQLNKLEPEISDTILGYLDKVEDLSFLGGEE